MSWLWGAAAIFRVHLSTRQMLGHLLQPRPRDLCIAFGTAQRPALRSRSANVIDRIDLLLHRLRRALVPDAGLTLKFPRLFRSAKLRVDGLSELGLGCDEAPGLHVEGM